VSSPIRVLLVEDNDSYRETLAFLLGGHEELEVVAGVASGGEAALASVEHAADVAVIDLRLPDVDGVEAAADVRERSPRTSVVFLSASAGAGKRPGGISGWSLVRKDAGVEALLEAIREAAGSGR
jgi:two-component system response regulator DesR